MAKLYEQLKDEFIAIASHELKTPVTSIKGYAQILVKEFKDSADEKNYIMLTRLEHQIDRLIDLIKNLLDTTRLTTGEVLLNIVPFDLGLLIEEQVDIFQRVSTKHQIIFEVEKGHTVFADRKMVAQVISNFISNAVKYSPNGGQVINSSAKTKQGFKVSVQDFGIGIPEGLDPKIFERYFRIPHQQGTAIPGIGLGLYITAQIIRQHGGKITVESKEGVGSTFSFELPQKI